MSKLTKSKTFKIGLVGSIIGLGVFGLTVGLSSLAKYRSEHPRKVVNDFATKVSTLSFSPDAFFANSDYWTIKNHLLDSKNQIKNSEKVLKSFSFFSKNGDQLEKINLEDPEYKNAGISFHILEIIPDDVNQNFKVKFQLWQKFANGDIAKSDIYQEESVAFIKQSNLLVAEFNFSLKKITDKLNQQVGNLSLKSTNFADDLAKLTKPTSSYKNPASFRVLDFQEDLNQARNSEELVKKLAIYFPSLDNLITKLNESSENKLPGNSGHIFEFSLRRSQATNQYVSVQNQIPFLFLEADLSQSARDLIGQDFNFRPIVSSIKLQKQDNSSYFLDFNQFLANLKLKDITKTDFNEQGLKTSAYEILSTIRSGFFDNNDLRSDQAKESINKILKNKIKFDFGKLDSIFSAKGNSESLQYYLDVKRASLDKTNKSTILIPFRLKVDESFFKTSTNLPENIIARKDGIFKLTGFDQGLNNQLPKINQEIYKTKYLPFFEKGKENQDLVDFGGEPIDGPLLISKVEVDALFKENKPEAIHKVLETNYNYQFNPYQSLLDSWTGNLVQPKLENIKALNENEKAAVSEAEIAEILSRDFFLDGHQVASFYQDLLTKDRLTVIETLYELGKKWGLHTNTANFPRWKFRNAKNIFEEATQYKFLVGKKGKENFRKITKLTFNGLYRNEKGQGFYATLVLPKEIKDKLANKTDAEVFAELKKHSLIDSSGFKTRNIDKKLLEGEDFENFGDLLKAFFLKAAQFNNFAPWAKLDDNLKYSFVPKKGDQEKDGKKAEIDKKVKELTDKISPPASVPPKSETAKPVAAKPEAAKPLSSTTSSVSSSSLEGNYLPISFGFKLSYRDGAKSELKTPEIKVFLELQTDKDYQENKIIKELDKTVLELQSEFKEWRLDESAFSSLTFPKSQKSEGTPNQGKKAEGAPNQSKKSEENSNKLTEYIQELGTKVEKSLKSKGKNYSAEVEKIIEAFSGGYKFLDFALVEQTPKPETPKTEAAKPETPKPVAAKPEAAKPVAARPEAAKVAAKPSAAKPVSSPAPKKSTLYVRVLIRKKENKQVK
ncbi:Protein P97-copy 2 [Mesomycoplasma hyopneumoniae 168]|uniref:Protein P97-copy 2 n=4 Tax=Mesomycoplasma hyopneumoniae TaxID=2099 RepID=E4QSJ9_MESH1|nr:P97 family multifunctional adhesin Mhp271 [Mesomycoplasma hyopneumoniae]ADQ90409.1 Protein P97-copy 2 [Mesomycoplasma hyopneumoniae 168]AGM21976.1 Protein P97-copy 2 [Mesomycoplasma hyopneumoniae 168-L]